MNKFKLLLASLGLFLPIILLAAPAGVLFASSLDLVDSAPGDFWGKVDGSATNGTADHVQFTVEQGVKFRSFTWLTWYTAMTWWQDIGTSKSNYWSYGVKNTTWIPNLTLGIEEERYIFCNPVILNNALVGYAALSLDWNLKKGRKNE